MNKSKLKKILLIILAILLLIYLFGIKFKLFNVTEIFNESEEKIVYIIGIISSIIIGYVIYLIAMPIMLKLILIGTISFIVYTMFKNITNKQIKP